MDFLIILSSLFHSPLGKLLESKHPVKTPVCLLPESVASLALEVQDLEAKLMQGGN